MAHHDSLRSLAAYARYVAAICARPTVQHSTLVVWSDSPYTGVAEGEIYLTKGFRLRIREELDFEAGLITSYGYEAYRGEERLYWYDDFPHPNDPTLAATYPHHKHVPPDIKRNRIPAPGISANKPNLSAVIEEGEELEKKAV
jgi:hypothetical protein